jgi:hypothetical protein
MKSFLPHAGIVSAQLLAEFRFGSSDLWVNGYAIYYV